MVKLSICLIVLITLTLINAPIPTEAKSISSKGKSGFLPISPADPLPVKDANFVISEINRLSQTKTLKKLIKVTKASILLKEYVKIDFQLATTQCKKGDSTPLAKCPIDSSVPIIVCKDVIVDNQPFREVPIKVTQYNNCQP